MCGNGDVMVSSSAALSSGTQRVAAGVKGKADLGRGVMEGGRELYGLHNHRLTRWLAATVHRSVHLCEHAHVRQQHLTGLAKSLTSTDDNACLALAQHAETPLGRYGKYGHLILSASWVGHISPPVSA